MDKSRPRVKAIHRDPRVSVVLRATGKSVTAKGRCVFADELDDRRMVYRGIAEKQARLSGGMIAPDTYAQHLEAKGSVVFEVIPEKWISYDAAQDFPGPDRDRFLKATCRPDGRRPYD
jgi:hypothetical protein